MGYISWAMWSQMVFRVLDHCTVSDRRSHTGYSNTSCYSGQDMAIYTNITQRSKKQIKWAQPNQKIATKEGEAQGGGVQPSRGRCSLNLQVNLLVDASPTRTDTHGQQRHGWGTDTDRFTVTVTVPVQLAGWLCHLEMLRQGLQEGWEEVEGWGRRRLRLDSSIPLTTNTLKHSIDLCATNSC